MTNIQLVLRAALLCNDAGIKWIATSHNNITNIMVDQMFSKHIKYSEYYDHKTHRTGLLFMKKVNVLPYYPSISSDKIRVCDCPLEAPEILSYNALEWSPEIDLDTFSIDGASRLLKMKAFWNE